MGRQVYQASDYKVYRAGNDFIVHHARYDFEEKHSHLKSLNLAKQVIRYLQSRTIPKTQSLYVLVSLTRLTDDLHYKSQIEQLMDTRAQKGKKLRYCNRLLAMRS